MGLQRNVIGPKLTWYNIGIVAFVCLGGFTYGFAFSVFVTSIGQPGFYTYFKLDPTSAYTNHVLGAVNALFAAGAAFGAIIQGFVGEPLGRKWTIFVASVLCVIGGALVAGSVNVPMIVVVRFIQGLGLGMLISSVPLYIVEVAPPHRRGILAGCTACSLACGYVVCAWIGFGCYYSKNSSLQWRMPLALACLAPLILSLGIYWIPESPRFLCWKNRQDEAWMVLQRIHHDPTDQSESAARAEFIQISKQVEYDRQIKTTYWEMFRKPSWRKRSLLALFLMFATQSAGILGIGNYSIIIYESLGLSGSIPLLMYAVYVVIGTIPNFLSAIFMDNIGRRTMFLIGYPITGCCLLATALLQRQYIGTTNKHGLAAALFFIFLYEFLYGFFLDAPQFTWVAEIFPTTIRGKGIGLAWFAYFIGTLTYTAPGATAFKNIGWKYYLVWICCDVASTIIIYFFVPETRNLSLEEISALFGDEVVVHRTADGHGIIETDKVSDTNLPEAVRGHDHLFDTHGNGHHAGNGQSALVDDEKADVGVAQHNERTV